MVSISGITNGVKTFYGYGKRFLETAPELALGSAAEDMGKAMRSQSGSLFDKAAAGWHKLEEVGSGSFFKKRLEDCKSLIPGIKDAIAKNTEGLSGFGKLKGTLKGIGQGLNSKMPFIVAASYIVFELPNIYKATKEQGLLTGVKETVKAGARLIGAGLGSAIGSAICPGIGTFVGWIAGEWITKRIVGKTYSEKKAEAEETANQTPQDLETQTQQMVNPYSQTQGVPQTQVPFGTYNPYAYNDAFNNPYKDDIFMNQLPFNAIA